MNTKAQAAYLAERNELLENLELLKQAVLDDCTSHLSLCNWGDVSDVSALNELVKEATDKKLHRGEYAS